MRRIGWVFVLVFLIMLVVDFTRRGIYTGALGLNLVVVGDSSVSLMLFRPQSGVMTWVRMPGNLEIKITGTGAVYPLYSLWSFGIKERNTYKLISKSLSETLGVILPRVVKVKGDSSPVNLLSGLGKVSLSTDLSVRDRILLRRDLVGSVNSKKILEIEIPSSALDKKVEPDGLETLGVNYVVSLWTKNKFIFDTLLGENSNIKINNLTKINGAGQLLSRQLESAGLRVVEVGSGNGVSVAGEGCVFKSLGNNGYSEYLLEKHLMCRNISGKKDGLKGEGIEVWLL